MTTTAPSALSRRIRKLRKARKMSLKGLADAVGVKAPSVYEWESGGGNPRVDRLPRIAAALGVTVAELMGAKS